MFVRGTDYRWLPTIAAAVAALTWFARLFWVRVTDRMRALAAGGWPTAEALVETFYVVNDSRRNRGLRYLPVLQYSYTVDGERYSGEFNLGVFEADRDTATDIAKHWVGERILIRYKPLSPGTSAWLKQDGAPEGVRSAAPEPWIIRSLILI
jgi:Protein of unknown function (DUF3592)